MKLFSFLLRTISNLHSSKINLFTRSSVSMNSQAITNNYCQTVRIYEYSIIKRFIQFVQFSALNLILLSQSKRTLLFLTLNSFCHFCYWKKREKKKIAHLHICRMLHALMAMNFKFIDYAACLALC